MKRFLVALWLLSPAAALAQAPEAKAKVTIFTALGWTLGVGFDSSEALERLLKEEPERVKLVGVEYSMPYLSEGHFLLDASKGVARDSLPAGLPAVQGEVEVLEGLRSVLWAEPKTDYPLLEKILERAQDGTDPHSYSPSVRLAKGRLETFSGKSGVFRSLAVGDRPPGAWGLTFSERYDLLIDGKPVRATFLGKPYGGFSSVLPALLRRRAALGESSLGIGMGSIALPPKYGVEPRKLLRSMTDAGLSVLAFHPNDIEYGWAAMIEAAQSGAAPRPVLLASNLAPRDKAAAGPFRRYHVETVGGVKVGVLSLLGRSAGTTLERLGLPWTVEDPIATARRLASELRFGEKVDLVVAVTHLEMEAAAQLDSVEGIDLILGDASGERGTRRRTVVDVRDWSREVHYKPLLTTRPSYFAYGEVSVDFRDAAGRWEPVRVTEEAVEPGPYLPRDAALAAVEESVYGFFDETRRLLLPDPRLLWPGAPKPKVTYAPAEFWNVAAQVLRRRTGAEVALLRVKELNSNSTGEVAESFASTWFDADERVVRFKLSGAALRALMPRVVYETFPVSRDDHRRLDDEVWLAQAGLDQKGLVHGLPLRDEEVYEVAATEALLAQTEALPALKGASDLRRGPSSVDRLVLPWLIDRHASAAASPQARSAYEREVRSMAEGVESRGPVWRLHLRELSAQFSNTQLHNEGPFSRVKDARIQSVSQVQGQGTARLFSEYYQDRWRWDVGASARYGKVILKPRDAPPVENKTQDQCLLETELSHRTWRLERGAYGYSAGPFVNAAYDTEFTPPLTPGVPIRRFFSVKPGLRVFEGVVLKDLRASAVIQTDYSTPQRRTEYGFETGFETLASLPQSRATLRTKATYLQFEPNRLDTLADLRRQLEVGAKLSVPVAGDFRLSPFADFFLFDSKLLPQRGYNLVFGVSLEFSRLWKPVY